MIPFLALGIPTIAVADSLKKGSKQNAQFFRDCDGDHWISSNSNSGKIIILEDGSKWLIDDIDTIDTGLWMVTEEIVVRRTIVKTGKNNIILYELINTDNDEEVSAERVN